MAHSAARSCGYWVGNRNNQLISDIWYAILFGYGTAIYIESARKPGLAEDAIQATVRSTTRKALQHRSEFKRELTQTTSATLDVAY